MNKLRFRDVKTLGQGHTEVGLGFKRRSKRLSLLWASGEPPLLVEEESSFFLIIKIIHVKNLEDKVTKTKIRALSVHHP